MSMHCNKTYKTIQVAWDWDSCGRGWHGVAGVKMRWMALAKFWQAARWQIGCRKTHSLGHDVAACKQRRTGGRRQKDTLKMSFKSALSQKYPCMVAAKKMLVVKENCYGVTFFNCLRILSESILFHITKERTENNFFIRNTDSTNLKRRYSG